MVGYLIWITVLTHCLNHWLIWFVQNTDSFMNESLRCSTVLVWLVWNYLRWLNERQENILCLKCKFLNIIFIIINYWTSIKSISHVLYNYTDVWGKQHSCSCDSLIISYIKKKNSYRGTVLTECIDFGHGFIDFGAIFVPSSISLTVDPSDNQII